MYPKLDIADRSSVENLASSVKEKHGVVDILINNAGVNVDDEYSPENVKVTLDTNVRGTLQVSMGSLVFDLESNLKRGMSSANVGHVISERYQRFPHSYHFEKLHGTDLKIYSSNLFLLLVLYKD